jgi:glycogen debranching enzyme
VALLTLEPGRQGQASYSDFSGFDYQTAYHQLRQQWKRRLAGGAALQFPSQKLTESFLANRSYLQTFDRGATLTPGALTYSHCWLRDSAFMLHALNKLGFHEQAEEKLLNLPTRQARDGYFAFQEGEWDSNGLAIWSMLEHFKLTGDRELLRHLYPSLSRGADWIERVRQGTKA